MDCAHRDRVTDDELFGFDLDAVDGDLGGEPILGAVSAAGAAAALSVWGAGAGWTPMTDTVLLLVLTT